MKKVTFTARRNGKQRKVSFYVGENNKNVIPSEIEIKRKKVGDLKVGDIVVCRDFSDIYLICDVDYTILHNHKYFSVRFLFNRDKKKNYLSEYLLGGDERYVICLKDLEKENEE